MPEMGRKVHARYPATFCDYRRRNIHEVQRAVTRMVQGGRLDRVIFDEAHMIVHDSRFRNSSEHQLVYGLRTQVISSTATLPSYMEGDLSDLAGVKGATFVMKFGRLKTF